MSFSNIPYVIINGREKKKKPLGIYLKKKKTKYKTLTVQDEKAKSEFEILWKCLKMYIRHFYGQISSWITISLIEFILLKRI